MSNELIETRAKVGAVYYIYGVWHDTTTKKQYLIYVPQIFTKEGEVFAEVDCPKCKQIIQLDWESRHVIYARRKDD